MTRLPATFRRFARCVCLPTLEASGSAFRRKWRIARAMQWVAKAPRGSTAASSATRSRTALDLYMSCHVSLGRLRWAGATTSSIRGLSVASSFSLDDGKLTLVAHRKNAASPNYEGSEYFEGREKRRFGIAPELYGDVARKMNDDAEIERQKSKAREVKGGAGMFVQRRPLTCGPISPGVDTRPPVCTHPSPTETGLVSRGRQRRIGQREAEWGDVCKCIGASPGAPRWRARSQLATALASARQL